MATMSVGEIRGITKELTAKLKEHKLSNTEDLLKAGKTPAARKELAASLKADPKEILELLNRADLARLSGVGEVYSNLLEEAGVDTVKELSKRVPANLHAKLDEINAAKKLTAHPPTIKEVEGWVAQAKTLPVMLEY